VHVDCAGEQAVVLGVRAAGEPAAEQLLLFGGGKANHTNGRGTCDWNGTTWHRAS
jgi:hypothetical protein